MQPVAGVVLEVVQIHECRLGGVVVRKVEVPTSAAITACVQADSEESRTVSRS